MTLDPSVRNRLNQECYCDFSRTSNPLSMILQRMKRVAVGPSSPYSKFGFNYLKFHQERQWGTTVGPSDSVLVIRVKIYFLPRSSSSSTFFPPWTDCLQSPPFVTIRYKVPQERIRLSRQMQVSRMIGPTLFLLPQFTFSSKRSVNGLIHSIYLIITLQYVYEKPQRKFLRSFLLSP